MNEQKTVEFGPIAEKASELFDCELPEAYKPEPTNLTEHIPEDYKIGLLLGPSGSGKTNCHPQEVKERYRHDAFRRYPEIGNHPDAMAIHDQFHERIEEKK